MVFIIFLDDDILVDDRYMRSEIEKCSKFLYGMIHARFILTVPGMSKMLKKYENADYGCCPRTLCESQKLLPVGLSDIPGESSVKLFCALCKDVYEPKNNRTKGTDGAFFGTTFPHLFLKTFSDTVTTPFKAYNPRIFGFKLCKGFL